MVPLLPGDCVSFTDADGAEHTVVLAHKGPFRERRARQKLERWRKQGRAFYTPPLTFVNITRR